MLTAEQLALLGEVKDRSVDQPWADIARQAVESFQADLFATRCGATRRNLASLEELGADVLTKGVVVSLCAIHHVFHLYDSARALNAASSIAVAAQSKISTAEATLDADEVKRLRGRVVHAREAFYAAVRADEAAMVSYRRFGLFTPLAALPAPSGKAAKTVAPSQTPGTARNIPGGANSPLAVRREQAQRVRAEIGITDTQLVEFYRCFRKKKYDNVAAAVNATLLVHKNFERMGVYLCAHCSNLHIGHRSRQGESLNPAFFTRALARWQAEPELAARFQLERLNRSV